VSERRGVCFANAACHSQMFLKKNKFHKLLFVMVAFASVRPVSGAERENVTLEWPVARGARGYLIEIKDALGSIIFTETTTVTHRVVQLEPGEYRVRITMLNKFGKFDPSRDWESYIVAKANDSSRSLPVVGNVAAFSPGIDSVPANKTLSPDSEIITQKSESLDRGALWRSALLPGWGQSYQDRNLNALLIGGSAGAVALAGAILYPKYWRYETAYQQAARSAIFLFTLSPTVGFLSRQQLAVSRRAVNIRASNLNALAAGFAGIYVWNMMDVTIVELGRSQLKATLRPGTEGFDIRFVCTL